MSRGVLRVYLGAAPGVGKTFAMLDEGWRRHGRGTDVVVGYVETHGRPRTASQLRDLEIAPRRVLEHEGSVYEEMDIDAILARRPGVVLVDELEHTNVPGSRHAKRWQDVDELLAAGVTVITTLNIEHLESLRDVVAQITGVDRPDTVPDGFVRQADQIELVDSSPESLRRRLAHGNIYSAEQIDGELRNYFREGNLTALRELALLWVADRVDESLQAYRERHSISAPWETRERVVVGLGGAPGSEDLIRRAARMASRTKGELLGVHIRTDDRADGSHDDLHQQRALLEDLGGRYLELSGSDAATALVAVARSENATQIVLGASRRSRWAELTHGSLVNDVIRQSGRALDVHVISTDTVTRSGDQPLRPNRRWHMAHLPRRRRELGLMLAVFGLPLLTLVATRARDRLGFGNAVLIYLLCVLAIATTGGFWSALAAVIIGFGLLDWYFAPPLHTFTIAHLPDRLALFSFVTVAAVVSGLVDVAARRRIEAFRARSEAESLAQMATSVLRDPDPIPRLVADMVTAFGLDGAALLGKSGGTWRVDRQAGARPPTTPTEATTSITIADDTVLALSGADLRAEDLRLLDMFTTQLGIALERQRLQTEAAEADSFKRANELRAGLLAAVSHDLRTPLASIKACATSLLSFGANYDGDDVRTLLETIDLESDRLDRLVANLLDMSRIQANAVVVQPRATGIDEIVAQAVASIAADSRIDVAVSEDLPLVWVDPTLAERSVANIIANAVRHSPPAERVHVRADRVGVGVEVAVIDHGQGIARANTDRVFQPFQRIGDAPNGSGIGLGLAVARGFARANGGDIEIDETPHGGCTMTITFPLVPVTTPIAEHNDNDNDNIVRSPAGSDSS